MGSETNFDYNVYLREQEDQRRFVEEELEDLQNFADYDYDRDGDFEIINLTETLRQSKKVLV